MICMLCFYQVDFPDQWRLLKTSSRDNPITLALEEEADLQECALYRETSISACLSNNFTQYKIG